MLEFSCHVKHAGVGRLTKGDKKALIHRAVWESIVSLPNNTLISTSQWLQVTTPGAPAPHMNGVYRCDRPELDSVQISQLVRDVIQFYKEQKLSFRWKTSEATRPVDLPQELRRQGMLMKDLLYGFCVETDEFNDSRVAAEITFKALELDTLEDWLQTQSSGWKVPATGLDHLREVMKISLQKLERRSHTYIAYWQGKPVGAAGYQLSPNKDYAYMVGGAVDPEYRGRGIYKALITARFAALRERRIPAVFHCVSTTSAPICLRLGFEKICEIESYEPMQDWRSL